MTAIAKKVHLLIARPQSNDAAVHPVYLDDNKIGVFPPSFVRRDLRGAELIDPECTFWRLTSIEKTGIALPKESDEPIFSFVVGLLTFSPLVKVKLRLERWSSHVTLVRLQLERCRALQGRGSKGKPEVNMTAESPPNMAILLLSGRQRLFPMPTAALSVSQGTAEQLQEEHRDAIGPFGQ